METSIKGQKEVLELKHKLKMTQIEAERLAHKEIEDLKFDHLLQLHRLKRADIRRTQDRKEAQGYVPR